MLKYEVRDAFEDARREKDNEELAGLMMPAAQK